VKYVNVLAEHKISLNELQLDAILKTLLMYHLTHKGERAWAVEDCAAFLQARFERRVHDTVELRTLARKAFQSFIRSYATYPADLKYIFHVKNLHLGHVAKSFALGETPSKISSLVGRHVARVAQNDQAVTGKNRRKDDRLRLDKNRKSSASSVGKSVQRAAAMHLNPMSEFASGLD
jgi:ATP-dependent RNA helicase DDX31/DBP7